MPVSDYRRSARSVSPQDTLLDAIQLTHPDAGTPLLIVNATADVTVGEDRYLAMPFGLRWPDQGENRLPRAEIEVDNVGRRLTRWIEDTDGLDGAQVRLMQIRQPADGSALVVEQSVTLDVAGAQIDTTVVRVSLGFGLGLTQAAVAIRYTPETAPSLFSDDG